jgi:hypothetical protein
MEADYGDDADEYNEVQQQQTPPSQAGRPSLSSKTDTIAKATERKLRIP